MTKQELQVLKLMAKGLSNKEIAKEMCLSVCTINGYVANIYEAIGINNSIKG